MATLVNLIPFTEPALADRLGAPELAVPSLLTEMFWLEHLFDEDVFIDVDPDELWERASEGLLVALREGGELPGEQVAALAAAAFACSGPGAHTELPADEVAACAPALIDRPLLGMCAARAHDPDGVCVLPVKFGWLAPAELSALADTAGATELGALARRCALAGEHLFGLAR